MSAKKTISFVLATIMIISGTSFVFAREVPNKLALNVDQVNSDSAVEPSVPDEVEDLLPNNKPFASESHNSDLNESKKDSWEEESSPKGQTISQSDTDIAYQDENIVGGNIYFDTSTGTITDADKGITSAIIPSTINGINVTTIGEYAFSDCTLTSITILDGITNIEDFSFSSCDELKNITIPNSVTCIGYYAFSGCQSLTDITIPNSVTYIGEGIFYGCPLLKNITLSNDITSIPKNAFEKCLSLTSLILPNSLTSIQEAAFRDCSSLESMDIPDGVIYIGRETFYDCTALRSMTVPNSVVFIGEDAFEFGLFNLFTTLITGQVGLSYRWRSDLEKVELLDGVTYVNENAFSGLTSLESITIADSVTSIGNGAFKDCRSLTSIDIPENVVSIGDSVFYGCDSLTNINVAENNTEYCDIDSVLFDKNCTSVLCYPAGKTEQNYIIPNGTTSIGSYAFVNCNSLVGVTVPDSVTHIDNNAFYQCKNLIIYCKPDTCAEIYAKENNIPYSTEKFVDYTLTEADIPPDIGEGIRFEKKIYEYDENYFVFGEPPFEAVIINRIKDESMRNKVTLTFSDASIVDARTNTSPLFGIADGGVDYPWKAEHDLTLLKNGETIVTATLPNGDSSSCLIRVKCYGMGYDVKKDFTKLTDIDIKTNLEYDDTLNYSNKHFDRDTIHFKLSIQNIARTDHEYTPEELNTLALKGVFVKVQLPTGLSFERSNVSDKVKDVIIIQEIPVGADETVEFDVYPTEPAARLLNLKVCIDADNYSDFCYANILLNSDEALYYDVSTPKFKGFIFNGQFTENTPEESFVDAVDAYKNAALKYEDYTIDRLNSLKKVNVDTNKEDDIYNKIKDKIDKELNVAYYPAWSKEQKNAVNKALFEFIGNRAQEQIDLGNIDIKDDMISIEANLINKIKNAITNEYFTYDEGNYKVSFSITGIFGAFNSTNLTITDKKTNIKDGLGGFTSTTSKVATVMSDYVNELAKISTDVVNDGIISAIDFFGDTVGINKYIKDKFIKNFSDKIAPVLRNKGLEDIAVFAEDFSKSYKIINKLDFSDLGKSRKLINEFINLDFSETPSISDKAAETAYNKVITARNKLISAATSYLYGVPQETGEFRKYLKSIGIMCPVDIIVYDANNNELGSIIDDEITCNSDIIQIDKQGDLKLVQLLQDENIHLEIIAKDYGTLSVTVEDYNYENIALGRTNFYDIPMNINEVFTSEISGSANENISINSADTVYAPSEQFSASESGVVNISVSFENGTVDGNGTYVKGDPVTLTATPIDEYKFVGWFNGDEFLQNTVLYEFTAKEDLNLTAKFEPIETATEVPEIQKGDLDGNGEVDSRDSLILFKYIAGDAVDIDESLVDFNNDNIIDSRDSLILFKYVAGDNVALE